MTVAFKSPLTSSNLNNKLISRTDNQNASGDINFVNGIQIDGIALDKASGCLDVGGSTGIKLPDGNTAARPSAGNGVIRYNTQTNKFEAYENGGWTNIVGAASARSFRAATTTDSITTADDTVSYSGASFTATLPTAVGNSGKIFKIIHNGTSLTQVYTLATTSGQTIGGIAGGSYALYTNGEVLEIESDGANWIIVNHYAQTDWTEYTLVSGTDIKGTTSDPTFATTPAVKKGYWRRSGCNLQWRFEYKQTSATGAASGSGDYKFLVPGSLSIDTTKLSVTSAIPANFDIRSNVGNGFVTSNASFATCLITPFDANYVRLYGFDVATYVVIGSTNPGMTNSGSGFLFYADLPILGWQP